MARQARQHRREEEEEESDPDVGPEEFTHPASPKPTFEHKNGDPISFYIHKSVRKFAQRQNLKMDIEVCSEFAKKNWLINF
jgi:hypothetical protein